MGSMTIHAGDFLPGSGNCGWTGLSLRTVEHAVLGESIPFTQLATVEMATEETVKKLGGTIGWGTAGALILGPVGLLAGLLLGGKKKEVTFVCALKDGRKFMATAESKVFTQLKAACF
jgi:hypothetical protein